MRYDPTQIEPRWQAYWAQYKTFRTPNPGDPGNGKLDPSAPKFYVLDMFPYPSGVGLHVGHPVGYIATDIVARYKRMRGFNVLHPMGFDAFGLAAEQFAVEHGVHPRVTTQQNIDNMLKQFRLLGLGYDWDRCISTTDVAYYKWTQWVFLQLYNSYFDPIENKARPIGELQKLLQNEQYYVGLDGELVHAGAMEDLGPVAGHPTDARRWSELDEDQQRALLDEYRLAYLDEVAVNWCPRLGTVLANEEVTNDGRSERGNHPVFKRPLKQWMLRITAYADRLADELDAVDWPEPIKLMQRNWIGRSEGAEIDFPLAEQGDSSARTRGESIRVFTTRPDTLFGATYMVLAPEHPLVVDITTPEQRDAVNAYRTAAAIRSDVDRQTDADDGKTGVFTGAYAINPVNDQKVPIWIADYVLMGYGTGAIMAVPAHDERDHAFAGQFGLPIVPVLDADVTERAFTGDAPHINSANREVSLDGLNNTDAKRAMIDWLVRKGIGSARVQYKLRDWVFSRQRYWGEPFPILHDLETGRIVALDESELPVELPPMEDFTPRASEDPGASVETPLSRAPDAWKYVTRNGRRYVRELNTMPQWAGSCWYYLRYLDPANGDRFVGEDAERYWMTSRTRSGKPHAGGVDLYIGGVEHAVLHLLYARFWHKVLYDLGHVSTPEPFGRLFNQGYIQAYYYEDARGVRVPANQVVDQDGRPATEVQDEKGRQFFYNGEPVTQRYGKMGKSLKNAVAPEDVIAQYGTDTLRLYEMYMGPLDQSKVWNTRDMVGSFRFLQRVWRNLINDETGELLVAETAPPRELARKTHQTIKRVTEAMESMSFNVAIAALIELNNELVPLEKTPRWVAETLVVMLAPLAPHIGEELWQRLAPGSSRSPGHTVADADWPAYDEKMLVADTLDYPVQVNGKLRGKVTVPADADDDAVITAAKQDPKVAAAIEGKAIRKAIVVRGKLANLVVG
jgi:leucyl-tRNA synthetase